MVVDDLDLFRPGLGPAKAHAVLVVDPDRVLSGSIALQFLQAQTGKRQRLQGHGGVQAVQDLGTTGMKVRWQGPPRCIRVLAIENILGTLAAE